MRVGIIGASGYTGAELLRLAAGHPELEVVLATGDTQAGTAVADLYPSLRPVYGGLVFEPYSPEAVDGLDLVFCGLPHGASQVIVPEVKDRVKWVLDLSADFRLKDPAALPPVVRRRAHRPGAAGRLRLRAARALPGRVGGGLRCGGPRLLSHGGLAGAGPAGAGRCGRDHGHRRRRRLGRVGRRPALKHGTQFCTVDEDFTAYGLLDHRHTPEMEQVLSACASTPGGWARTRPARDEASAEEP